jgi:hypothetical protein
MGRRTIQESAEGFDNLESNTKCND